MARPKKTTDASSPPKKDSPKRDKVQKKKKKDPNAPKRGLSAYMLWLNENRANLTKPGMGVADVARAAGAEWANVTDRTKWEKQAAEEKKRYEKEMAAYKGGDAAPKNAGDAAPKKAGKAK